MHRWERSSGGPVYSDAGVNRPDQFRAPEKRGPLPCYVATRLRLRLRQARSWATPPGKENASDPVRNPRGDGTDGDVRSHSVRPQAGQKRNSNKKSFRKILDEMRKYGRYREWAKRRSETVARRSGPALFPFCSAFTPFFVFVFTECTRRTGDLVCTTRAPPVTTRGVSRARGAGAGGGRGGRGGVAAAEATPSPPRGGPGGSASRSPEEHRRPSPSSSSRRSARQTPGRPGSASAHGSPGSPGQALRPPLTPFSSLSNRVTRKPAYLVGRFRAGSPRLARGQRSRGGARRSPSGRRGGARRGGARDQARRRRAAHRPRLAARGPPRVPGP